MTNLALSPLGPMFDPSAPPERIGLPVDGRLDVVIVDSIDWLESEGNYVRVHANGSIRLVRTTLAALRNRLGTLMFRQVHRSIVVNVARVVAVRPVGNGDCALVLTNGEELRMSRRYRDGLLSTFR